METGDSRTEDSGLTRNEENVIRLPRDWLGPPEELVPIGPAARARAAQRDLDDGMPPTADAFWSEDSAALHDAVQAPSAPGREHLEPPVGLVPPVAGLRAPGLRRLPRLRSLSGAERLSRWWSLLAVPVVALLVVAVIGSTEAPGSHPAAHHASSSHRTPPARVTSTAQAASSTAATEKFEAQVKKRPHAPVRGHSRTRARGGRPVKQRHRAASHHSSGSPAPTVTEAAASPPATHASAPASVTTTPSASTASTSGSRGSKPAPGRAGPTSIGSISGGCSVKCS